MHEVGNKAISNVDDSGERFCDESTCPSLGNEMMHHDAVNSIAVERHFRNESAKYRSGGTGAETLSVMVECYVSSRLLTSVDTFASGQWVGVLGRLGEGGEDEGHSAPEPKVVELSHPIDYHD